MLSKKPNQLKKKKFPANQRSPLWDYTKGITQSGLEKFLACREQFALGYIEGWTPRAFSTPLEFGSMIHFMLEQQFTGKEPVAIARAVTKSYHDTRKKTLDGLSYDALQLALTNAAVLFPLYVKYYEEEDAKYNWIQREHVFKLPHKFEPIGFTELPESKPGLRLWGPIQEIVLTGMRDGEYRNAKGQLGLFETKTKSSIDDIAIQDGLRADFQTMLYLYSLKREYAESPTEILYNVIRRPQLRLKQNEPLDVYGKRLAEDIQARPDWYFRRFEVTVLLEDIETFIETTLDPVLRQLLVWWESIKDSPFDRWGSPYHFRNLFALTNKYGKAPLYNLMILGRRNEYYQRSSPFPELEESSLEAVA